MRTPGILTCWILRNLGVMDSGITDRGIGGSCRQLVVRGYAMIIIIGVVLLPEGPRLLQVVKFQVEQVLLTPVMYGSLLEIRLAWGNTPAPSIPENQWFSVSDPVFIYTLSREKLT